MSKIPTLEYAMNSDPDGSQLPALLIEREYYRVIADALAKDATPESVSAAVAESKAELRKLPQIV